MDSACNHVSHFENKKEGKQIKKKKKKKKKPLKKKIIFSNE